MTPRRIVMAMIEPPLPFGSAAARWHYVLLKGLVERGHRVTAFATCSKPEEIERTAALFPPDRYDLRCFTFPARSGIKAKVETLRRPYSYMFSAEMRDSLERELDQGFDVLHLEHLWCGWLGFGHADSSLVNVHSLASIDLDESSATNWHQSITNRMAFRTERRLVTEFHFLLTCSERIQKAVRAINPEASVATVPFGIEMSGYDFIPDDQRSTAPVIGLIGSMRWSPGYSAAVRLLTRLYPEIKREVPEVTVQIAGWSARSALRDFVNLPGVEIVENLADVRPFFKSLGVLLYAPIRGSGMKIKVLEAMSFGVPVVTTTEGVEGLPAEDGVHAGIADDDQGLIERTVASLRDAGRQNRQRRAARALVESHCSADKTVSAVESIYERMGSERNGFSRN
ncbi:MAG: glycosyltransferase family 4 protein [Candidatus Binatus sp.]